MKSLVLGALGVLAALLCAQSDAADPVKTEGGLIQGSVEDGISVYKGVPFAAPPVGDLRWRAPQWVKPWTGVRQADQFAPACAQVPIANAALGIPEVASSEDCLYLNIWSPAQSSTERLPVLVWIYGGGFAAGATSYPVYDGTRLAKKGVVLVSIAYRLGPFGFLAHPALSAESRKSSGNYGLLDQIAALQWIKRNIASFGGDPQKVTIFGESAGGISVSMLAASPLAAGLFRGVICESGGSFAPPKRDDEGGENVPPLAVAEHKGEHFLSELGVSSIAEARQLPAEKILKAPGAGMMGGAFWPNFDGYVLPGDQYELYRAGLQNDTPVLVGSNSDEGAIFPYARTASAYLAQVHAQYGEYADKILKAYPAGSDAQAARSSRDLFRDTAFGWNTWTWARLQARTGRGKAFVYYFNHRPPYPDTAPFKDWGAIHASEIVYVFGNLAQPGVNYTSQDRALSDALMTYWTSFAKNGDPSAPGLPHWSAFSARSPAAMHFDGAPHPGELPNLAKLQVLDGYYAWRRAQESSQH